MDLKTCLKLLREILDVSFATVDEFGNPKVRIIDIMHVKNNNIYFLTARGKEFYKELLATNKVAIVGSTKNYQAIRVSGKIKKLNNREKWINLIFDENPSIKDRYPGKSRNILDVFCLNEGEVECFDSSKNPIYRESFPLNKNEISTKGFFISDNCIECETCYNECHQKAVKRGNPFKIKKENCLHCGLC